MGHEKENAVVVMGGSRRPDHSCGATWCAWGPSSSLINVGPPPYLPFSISSALLSFGETHGGSPHILSPFFQISLPLESDSPARRSRPPPWPPPPPAGHDHRRRSCVLSSDRRRLRPPPAQEQAGPDLRRRLRPPKSNPSVSQCSFCRRETRNASVLR
ncbi:hypothetical protein NL676_013797 [Syzygium grande]|nr:hypothetical protein NL676_013797 [Syzygium grande]